MINTQWNDKILSLSNMNKTESGRFICWSISCLKAVIYTCLRICSMSSEVGNFCLFYFFISGKYDAYPTFENIGKNTQLYDSIGNLYLVIRRLSDYGIHVDLYK